MKIFFVLCISRYFSVRTRSRSRTRRPTRTGTWYLVPGITVLIPVPPILFAFRTCTYRYGKRDCIIRENNNIEQQERTRNIFLPESWNINGIIRRYRTVQVKTVPGHLTAIFNYYIFRGIDSSLEVQLLPRAFFSRT